jgi:hypothetical protein
MRRRGGGVQFVDLGEVDWKSFVRATAGCAGTLSRSTAGAIVGMRTAAMSAGGEDDS